MAEDKKLIVKTAYLYFQEGRWDKAIGEFKRLIALDPEDLNARNMLGDAFVKKGSMKEAYEEYAYAAEGYSKRGESEKANAIYKKMAKLEVSNLDAAQQKKQRVISLIVRGDASYEQGNYEEAVLSYQEVVNIDAQNWEVVAKLADIYARLGKSREAATQYFTVGKFYLENRLFKRALLLFQKVVELDSGNVDARMALGDLLAREGQELEARREFQAVAEYFISQNDLDKATQCCQKALQLKSIDAHYLMGEIYIRRGMFEEAKTELESFLKIKSSHLQAQYSLGLCHMNRGALDDALATFGKILGKQPDHIDSLERMAEIYEKKGAVKDAIAQYLSLNQLFTSQRVLDRAEGAVRKTLALENNNIEARKRMAELYELRGMKREAGQEYLAALYSAREQTLSAEVAAFEQKIRAIDPALLGAAPPVGAPQPAPAVPAAEVPPALAAEAPPAGAAQPEPAPIPAAPKEEAPLPPPPPLPKPKPALSPQQRAQRFVSMAQSALRQNLYDEALDLLQQAQQLVPQDVELKATVQKVLREYAKGAAPLKKGAPKAAAKASVAPAESQGDMERRIREQVEREMRGKFEQEMKAVAAPEAVVEAAPVAEAVAPQPGAEDEASKAEKQRLEEEIRRQLAPSMEPAGVQEALSATEIPASEAPAEPPAETPPPAPVAAEDEVLTETMAELYLRQGHAKDALRIYEELLRQAPGRADLRERVSGIIGRMLRPERAKEEPVRAVPPAQIERPPAETARTTRPRVSYV